MMERRSHRRSSSNCAAAVSAGAQGSIGVSMLLVRQRFMAARRRDSTHELWRAHVGAARETECSVADKKRHTAFECSAPMCRLRGKQDMTTVVAGAAGEEADLPPFFAHPSIGVICRWWRPGWRSKWCFGWNRGCRQSCRAMLNDFAGSHIGPRVQDLGFNSNAGAHERQLCTSWSPVRRGKKGNTASTGYMGRT